MKWDLKEPQTGDMIRVKSNSIYHYGVFISDDEVIQFGLAPTARPDMIDSDVEVCASDIDVFLQGGFLEVGIPDKKEERKRIKPAETVRMARSRIGEKGYNILYNNCEHFAYECVMGTKTCTQADSVRDFFRNIPIVDIYTASLPDSVSIGKVHPRQRKKDIDGCTNERVKAEKYCVWRLLDYAMNRTFGLNMKDVGFTKLPGGKWVSEEFCFSLSHSKGALAVAVSRKDVGVDIEPLVTRTDRLSEKILTETELAEYTALAESEKALYLTEKWTQKESIFKTGQEELFHPERIEASAHKTFTKTLEINGETFVLSAATETPERIRLYHDIHCFD